MEWKGNRKKINQGIKNRGKVSESKKGPNNCVYVRYERLCESLIVMLWVYRTHHSLDYEMASHVSVSVSAQAHSHTRRTSGTYSTVYSTLYSTPHTHIVLQNILIFCCSTVWPPCLARKSFSQVVRDSVQVCEILLPGGLLSRHTEESLRTVGNICGIFYYCWRVPFFPAERLTECMREEIAERGWENILQVLPTW